MFCLHVLPPCTAPTQSGVWAFLSFAGYSLPRGSDLWWCTPVLWASGVCCDNANHQCLHLHQQHSAIGYWHIPVFGQQSSRPRRQEYWSHWTYCLGCVYWYYGEGGWWEWNRDKGISVHDSASWAIWYCVPLSTQTSCGEERAALWVLWEFVGYVDLICRQCVMKFKIWWRESLCSGVVIWGCKEAGIKYEGILEG